MNGKNMLEAMSFVDEKYIDEAEKIPAKKSRKHYWVPLVAAAACLCMFVFTWPLRHPMFLASIAEDRAAKAPDNDLMLACVETIPTLAASAVLSEEAEAVPNFQITVRVTAVDETTFTATVLSGSMEEGAEITVTLPESGVTVDSEYVITYLPEEAENTVLTAQTIDPA